MGYVVDYHIHSTYSDGTLRPVELVRRYKEAEFDIISITDLNSIAGLDEAMIAGEALKIQVISGVELQTIHKMTLVCDNEVGDKAGEQIIVNVPFLGYDFDRKNLELLKTMEHLQDASKELKEIADVQAQYQLGTEQAINLINGAGGKGVLAYPGKLDRLGKQGSEAYWKNLDSLVKELKVKGLKGVECFFPGHTEDESWKAVQIAGKYHLHIIEGSGFRGDQPE